MTDQELKDWLAARLQNEAAWEYERMRNSRANSYRLGDAIEKIEGGFYDPDLAVTQAQNDSANPWMNGTYAAAAIAAGLLFMLVFSLMVHP
jgi:ferric-dicitrate binding protein FerR (iron transport regulator)